VKEGDETGTYVQRKDPFNKVIKAYLQGDVHHFTNANEGLLAATINSYDLVVTDIPLDRGERTFLTDIKECETPEEVGLEFIRGVQATDINRDTPIVVFSRYARTCDANFWKAEEQVMGAGATNYVFSPSWASYSAQYNKVFRQDDQPQKKISRSKHKPSSSPGLFGWQTDTTSYSRISGI